MHVVASFDDISKQIKEAFPTGKALSAGKAQVYDHGFQDSMESMVLAMRAFRVSPSVVQDVVTTALDALGNNAPYGDDMLAGDVAVDIARTPRSTHLYIKTSATGVLFFQEMQEKLLVGLAFNKPKVAASFGLIVRSGVDFAQQEINQAKLDPAEYLSLLGLAIRDFDYTMLVHAKPAVFTQLEPFNATVNTQRGKSAIKQWVEATFDRLHAAGDSTVNRVWLARYVEADESPQIYEWGIFPGMVGVALPDVMFDHFAAQAALRAVMGDAEQDIVAAAEAPGQGG